MARLNKATRDRIARAHARGDRDVRVAAGQHGAMLIDCPSCAGFGKALGYQNMPVACAKCAGTGKTIVYTGASRTRVVHHRYHSHPTHPYSHRVTTKHRRAR